MTTQIGAYFRLEDSRPSLILAITRANHLAQWDTHPVPRADFLAAVATECDVIAIDRADLPTVGRRGTEFTAGNLIADPPITAEDAREAALEWLALAEHLDAHPPLSDLGTALVERAGIDREKAEHVARMLREDGWSR